MQQLDRGVRELLTARQVQDILHVDRSTVYRMAEDGRLPGIRVGKQWRFPATDIYALVADSGAIPEQTQSQPPADRPGLAEMAGPIADVAADLLGVMMVVTDMEGRPLTPIANPCPWFTQHSDDPHMMRECTSEWRGLADDHDFEPQFRVGQLGFECARAFIRSGRELVGMVLVGGVCPTNSHDPSLYELSPEQRTQVLRALPKVATAISRNASAAAGEPEKEKP